MYVADGYGKIADGTLIGDNLGNSIYTRSRNGVIFYGSVRDQEVIDAAELKVILDANSSGPQLAPGTDTARRLGTPALDIDASEIIDRPPPPQAHGS